MFVPYILGLFIAQTPTFEQNIKPIFTAYCIECHSGLTNYDTAYGIRYKIYDKVVLKKVMPKKLILKLSDYEIGLVRDWVNTGAKK